MTKPRTLRAPPPPKRFGWPLASSSCLALLLAVSAAVGACADIEEAPPPPPNLPTVAPQSGAPRLSIAQYRNAVRDLFGASVVVPAALEPDTSLSGFVSIGSAQSAISPRGVEQYEEAAYAIAEQALSTQAQKAALVPCTPKNPTDEECARAFVETLGRRVWRRPLAGDEVTQLAAVVTGAGKTLGDFYQGAAFGIAALLQAPSFLYRPIVGEADSTSPSGKRLSNYEMASRLSFFLWNSTPDDALLDAAERGELTQPQAVRREAERLLEDPRARLAFRNFVTEYLRLDLLDALSKDPTIFTYYSPDLGPAAREETLLNFETLAFDRQTDFRDVFISQRTFVNSKLASMYQVAAPAADGFAEVTLPADVPRRGLLGQISFLSLYAHPTSSSATLRGKVVRSVLLCGEIPPPPVDVNTAIPEPSPNAATLRDRVKIHLEDPFCASCHLKMDPIGLGLENFDGIGRYRATDNGATIDASGELDGAEFGGPVELAYTVRNHPDLGPCFTRRVYQYATSFVEKAADDDAIAALAARFEANGFKVKDLLLDIATSPGFLLAGEAP
ncbi:MAG: DUF1592 domain-containing protein [Polyangiaceae bacterium]|nr:DUF1592 domain-containing protein [Polyangiaceae bacterium]